MSKAHVFQHNTTGVQMFVFHAKDEIQARLKFCNIVIGHIDWIYLGEKTVLN